MPTNLPLEIVEVPSILQNIRRTSLSVFFAFFINPPLNCFLIWLLIIRDFDSFLRAYVECYQTKVLFILLCIYTLMVGFVYPGYVYFTEVDRLESLGYGEQWPNNSRRAIWVIITAPLTCVFMLATCGAVYHLEVVHLDFIVQLFVTWAWGIMISFGRLWLGTVKVRPLQVEGRGRTTEREQRFVKRGWSEQRVGKREWDP